MDERERGMIIEHATPGLKKGRVDLERIAKDLHIDSYSPDEMASIVHELKQRPGIVNEGFVVFTDPKFDEEIENLAKRKLKAELNNAEREASYYTTTQSNALAETRSRSLTLIQKFDAVLTVLYDISGRYPTDARVLIVLKKRNLNVDDGEVWDIFDKMRRDNLLHPPKVAVLSKRRDKILNLITFEGKLMKERGGLRKKIQREKFEKNWVASITILTLITSIATFYFISKGVTDDTLDKVNVTLQKELLRQDNALKLETNKVAILQRLVDTISKRTLKPVK